MRSAYGAIALAAALIVPSLQAAFDGTVTIQDNPYQYGRGGEFRAVSSGLGTFQTFCLETSETMAFDTLYAYNMNSGAVRGNGGATAVDPHDGISPMDPVSIGTAWLYSQFRAGTLAGYGAVDRLTDAGNLQKAFWFLEGEVGGVNNGWVALAAANLPAGYADVKDDANGYGSVIALNLFLEVPGASPLLRQDVLGLVPEPTTMVAGALLLLPFGASALRCLRKYRTA